MLAFPKKEASVVPLKKRSPTPLKKIFPQSGGWRHVALPSEFYFFRRIYVDLSIAGS
jgi:hypothetical protein